MLKLYRCTPGGRQATASSASSGLHRGSAGCDFSSEPAPRKRGTPSSCRYPASCGKANTHQEGRQCHQSAKEFQANTFCHSIVLRQQQE